MLLVFSNTNTAYGFLDFWGWEKKYDILFGENKELKNEIEKLELKVSKTLKLYDTEKHKNDVLNNDISNLETKSAHWEDQTYEYYEKLLDSNVKFNDKIRDYDVLSNTVNELEDESKYWEDKTYESNDKLKKSNDKLDDKDRDYDVLKDNYNILDKNYDKQINYNEELLDHANKLYDEAYKPRTEIDKTKIKWTAQDSKGNSYGINWDFASYEKIKIYSDYKSTNSKPTYLNLDGNRLATTNLEGFVSGNTFDCCIDELYDNSESNADFIWEVWYIVSQMAIYDLDVDAESDGRFALETLVRGGGDCEDLVILIAEMIKSSSYTRDWDIQYIYVDSKNLNDPQAVNHVILSINDGDNSYLIEATGKPHWDRFPNGVRGWSFDV